MARVQKNVNRTMLEKVIRDAEEGGPLANRNVLYASVAERYNVACGTRGNDYITPSIVYLRVKEWQLQVLTPIGKRGRPTGSKIPQKLDDQGNPIPRKRKGRKASDDNLSAMRKDEFKGSQWQGLLKRIENGSITARVKANCLSCAGFVREEIRLCQCVNCPLWDIRPFQTQTPSGLGEKNSEDTLDTMKVDSTIPESSEIVAV